MPAKKAKAKSKADQASLDFAARPLEVWELVRREGRDATYQITAMSPDGLTCTLTLM